MSNRKFVEFPQELMGKTLKARIASVGHQYKFAEIRLEIPLPEDSGTFLFTKRLWYTPPYSKETDFKKQNAAALHQWRTILEIPDGVTDREMVENISTLAMLDSVDYSLDVVMETGDYSGKPYPKVLSFAVMQKGAPDDWMSFRQKYRLMLLETNSLKERIARLERQLEENESRSTEHPGDRHETVGDYI